MSNASAGDSTASAGNSTGSSGSRSLRKRVGKGLPYLVLVLYAIWTLVPLVWMALSSFKPRGEIIQLSFLFDPTLQYYEGILLGSRVPGFLFNSILVASISAIVAVTFGTIGGYALSRSDVRGKKHLAFWIISTRMAPIAVAIIPLFFLFNFLNLLGTYTALIIAYSTFNLPFAIWMMRSFFDEIPVSIEEAALVDGATRWQAFRKALLPLVAPGIGATAIISVVFAWNDFLFALLFTNTSTQTIPVAAAQLIGQTGTDWGSVMATGLVILVPMVAFGIIVRDYLVSGLTMGAVKQ
jgi:multiple sugar transport system permease protein